MLRASHHLLWLAGNWLKGQGACAQAREGATTEGLWQAQCTLLLWLSQLLLIPFDLATVDSSAAPSNAPG